jgi:hypothetical protein
MKKFLAILLAFMLIATSAFAVTYTVQSRERGVDDQGANYVKARGVIAMDASYQCNTTTNNCGYAIRPATLGMNTISLFRIDPQWATAPGASGSVILFKYNTGGPGGSLVGAGVSGPTLRAYYVGTNAQAGLVSMPSYSLADLTAVPFEAIGT